MKTHIRRRDDNKELVIVFGGWGTDQHAFLPLCPDEYDLVLYYNYSADEPLVLPEVKTYDRTILIGWSLGIWAAEYMHNSMNIKPDISIAVNGTPVPADDHYGIPIGIFEATLNNINESGMEKYNQRLFGDKKILDMNRDKVSKRTINSFEDELRWLYNRIMETPDQKYSWDIALTSREDKIFPPENVIKYWDSREDTYQVIMDLPHYPFYHWGTFAAMIDFLLGKRIKK